MLAGVGAWRGRRAAIAGVLALPLLGGCWRESFPPETDTLPPEVERDLAAPIQTDATYYRLEQRWVGRDPGLETQLELTFHNKTAETIYFVNCRGTVQYVVEKWVDGDWEIFVDAVFQQCLSPPIVVEPGSDRVEPWWVSGALPGGNTLPAFLSDDVQGVYRIVIQHAVYNYDDSEPPFGDPVPLKYRYSNAFALDDPRR